MTAFVPAGSGGIPIQVEVDDSSGATNPSIVTVSMVTAGTEYSAVLPSGTKQYRIRLRDLANLQLSYTAGQSNVLYTSIPRGCFIAEWDLNLSAPTTIYFQSPSANQVAEIVLWT